ncbi:unnamed protein product [Amoebophrya sp. A25]|nr:unnamed protein product [Amoebophrya sp. A25]|eukprot:GSA25T00019653001.1
MVVDKLVAAPIHRRADVRDVITKQMKNQQAMIDIVNDRRNSQKAGILKLLDEQDKHNTYLRMALGAISQESWDSMGLTMARSRSAESMRAPEGLLGSFAQSMRFGPFQGGPGIGQVAAVVGPIAAGITAAGAGGNRAPGPLSATSTTTTTATTSVRVDQPSKEDATVNHSQVTNDHNLNDETRLDDFFDPSPAAKRKCCEGSKTNTMNNTNDSSVCLSATSSSSSSSTGNRNSNNNIVDNSKAPVKAEIAGSDDSI